MNLRQPKRVCAYCSKPFPYFGGKQIYCNPLCGRKAWYRVPSNKEAEYKRQKARHAVLAAVEMEGKEQCGKCGLWYYNLASHINQVHK